MWCMAGKPSAEFVYHMEDVLEVYHRPYDPKRPVVCVDETFKQMIGETRQPLPMRPGSVERFDYVYTRNAGPSLDAAGRCGQALRGALTTSTPAMAWRACFWPANPSRAGAISR